MKKWLLLILFISHPISGEINKPTLQSLFIKNANEYGIPVKLLHAIAYVESKYNIHAFNKHDGRSRHSSYGIMQIQYNSAKIVHFNGKRKDLMNPEININFATKYLKWIFNHSGSRNFSKTLVCYNSGPNSHSCKNNKLTPYVGLVLDALMKQKSIH